MTQHLKLPCATVLLYQGDDMDQLSHLRRKVLVAERRADSASSTARMGDDGQSLTEAQAEYDAFVDEAAERAVEVEIRAIGREFFRDLLAEHPPRMIESEPDEDGKTTKSEHEDDVAWGVNTETYPQTLLTFRKWDEEGGEDEQGEWVVTIAKPEFASDAKVQRFVNRVLTEGQFDQLWTAAHLMNRSQSADPKVFARSTSGSLSMGEI